MYHYVCILYDCICFCKYTYIYMIIISFFCTGESFQGVVLCRASEIFQGPLQSSKANFGVAWHLSDRYDFCLVVMTLDGRRLTNLAMPSAPVERF